jgi:4'-phosphopantetheinyl transferase
MAPDISAGTVMWLARPEHDIPSSGAWLTAGESARASAMSFPKRRTEYLLRRWVGKAAVAALIGQPDDLASLARIEVGTRPSGAPVVALGRLGCDLELVEPRSPGFVADFLTPAEREYVAGQPPADHDLAANLIWSAKESALKVLQTGLRRDTRSVEVRPGGPEETTGWARLEVGTADGVLLPGWWHRAGSFLVTVVAEASVPSPVALGGSGDLAGARPVHSWVGRPVPE